MPTYKKLVRDLIPEIIGTSGRKPVVFTLNEDDYALELRTKLQEEVQEYLEAHNIEELADILEVVFALAKIHGATEEVLLAVRNQKRDERGGFEKRIYLESVEE